MDPRQERNENMPFQMAQLVALERDLPDQVRIALVEGRRDEAGRMLMQSFELTCQEASELVETHLCAD
jgi:hypothetical protein